MHRASKSITGGKIRSVWWKPKGKWLHLSLAQKPSYNFTGELRENGVNSYTDLTAWRSCHSEAESREQPGDSKWVFTPTGMLLTDLTGTIFEQNVSDLLPTLYKIKFHPLISKNFCLLKKLIANFKHRIVTQHAKISLNISRWFTLALLCTHKFSNRGNNEVFLIIIFLSAVR